jgi:hypothetical protein
MDGATDKLQYTGDHYGGVLIDADALPGDLVVFGQMLEGMPCTRFESWQDFSRLTLLPTASLAQWREEEKRGVWLKVPSTKAHLISIAVEVSPPALTNSRSNSSCAAGQLGFAFHHADPAYVMLTLWLPKKTPSTLPGFASHYVGVRSPPSLALCVPHNFTRLCVHRLAVLSSTTRRRRYWWSKRGTDPSPRYGRSFYSWLLSPLLLS